MLLTTQLIEFESKTLSFFILNVQYLLYKITGILKCLIVVILLCNKINKRIYSNNFKDFIDRLKCVSNF